MIKWSVNGVKFISTPETFERDKIRYVTDVNHKIEIEDYEYTNVNSDCSGCSSNSTNSELSALGMVSEKDTVGEKATDVFDLSRVLDTDDFDDYDPNSDDFNATDIFNFN